MFGRPGRSAKFLQELFIVEKPTLRARVRTFFQQEWQARHQRVSSTSSLETLTERFGRRWYARLYRQKIPILRTADMLLTSSRRELIMVALGMLGEYGRRYPQEVFPYIRRYAGTVHHHTRAMAVFAVKRIWDRYPRDVEIFLKSFLMTRQKNVRLFVCGVLDMIVHDRHRKAQPAMVLGAIRWFMRNGDIAVKKAVGQVLSTLSRRYPDDVLDFLVQEVPRGNLHTYWMAYRAVGQLVRRSSYRAQVFSLLNIHEYHGGRRIIRG